MLDAPPTSSVQHAVVGRIWSPQGVLAVHVKRAVLDTEADGLCLGYFCNGVLKGKKLEVVSKQEISQILCMHLENLT